jgi:8-oxo-dGTP pyrophosphatase MutT (NUDIX family)
MSPDYRRLTQKTVTCFLHCGDQYLFVHRTKKPHAVDAGKLNGIGGKLEPNEDYLACAIRETAEETGYLVTEHDCHLVGVVNMTGGYENDWVMCFFSIAIPTLEIPIGPENDEGRLVWLHKDEVLTSQYQLVDDLHYCWTNITRQSGTFFASAVVDDHEKISQWHLSTLPAKI